MISLKQQLFIMTYVAYLHTAVNAALMLDDSSFATPASTKLHSRPIRASSPIPHSDSLSRIGLCPGKPSSSLGMSTLFFPLVLLLLGAPGLKPELLVLALSSATVSVYFGGDSFGIMEAVVLCVGVTDGVTSVLAVTSTSSASRYHFRRRVYLPQPS